jgi:release factor glutamine methyltransferase
MPTKVRDLLAAAKLRLRAAAHAPPAREAHLLLAHVLGWSEASLLARDDAPVTRAQERDFAQLIARRLAGEPVAYLTGNREFYGRDFAVDDRVLIPRPETEHLVAAALAFDLPPAPRGLDVGTGSGCIAITLALELQRSTFVATDRSLAALALARRNASRLGAGDRVRFLDSDWGSGLDLRNFDLVTSNPPYIAPAEAAQLSPEITGFEPHLALFAEAGGLAAYGQIFTCLSGLRAGTPVLCEVGSGQAPAVAAIGAKWGFELRATLPDYAGIERVVVVIRGR